MDSKPTAIVTTNIPVKAQDIWALFADFAHWNKWIPTYKKIEVIGAIKEGVGMIRQDTTIRGSKFTHELKEVNHETMTLKYHEIKFEPPVPVVEVIHTSIQIKAINDAASNITWSSVTKLAEGTDPSKLEPIVAMQVGSYGKGIKAAIFHLIFKKHYEEAFSLINDRMIDLYQALLLGQGPIWEYDNYERPPHGNGILPKMVLGLPASEALPPSKLSSMLGRLMEVAYLAIDKVLLHPDEKLPEGVDPYEAAALRIANVYGTDENKEITKFLAQHWEDDAEFAQQYLQGTNPIQIQAVKSLNEVPANMRHLKAQGKDLSELITDKRLFLADYEILADLSLQEGTFFYAPTILFFNERLEGGDSRLNIVGLRLERTENAHVYTPSMPQKNRWKFAKMCVSNADNQVHQFALHLGAAHLAMEPIVIAVHNGLPDEHPIQQLLKPHMQETIGINFLARKTLVASTGALTNKTFSVGTKQGVELVSLQYKQYGFYKSSFPEQLKSRGFDREGTDGLKYYLYREDGFKLWDLLGDYITEYVDAVYQGCDNKVKADEKLQGWAKEMSDPERAAIPEFKTEFTTRKELVEALRIIIWNGSAFHSFLNFAQWPYLGNIANRPNALYAPMPKEDGEDITPEYIQKALASDIGTLFQLSFTWALTLPSKNSLMDLGELRKKTGGQIGQRFHDSLVKLTHHLKERNEKLVKDGKAPYTFLIPENVAASVDI